MEAAEALVAVYHPGNDLVAEFSFGAGSPEGGFNPFFSKGRVAAEVVIPTPTHNERIPSCRR